MVAPNRSPQGSRGTLPRRRAEESVPREDAVLAPVERLQRQQEVDLVRRRIAGVRPARDPDLVAAKGNGLERAVQLCPGDAADAIEATAAAARRELPTGHRHETESLLADRVPTQRRFNGGQQAVARVLVQRQHLSELVEGGAGGVSSSPSESRSWRRYRDDGRARARPVGWPAGRPVHPHRPARGTGPVTSRSTR